MKNVNSKWIITIAYSEAERYNIIHCHTAELYLCP